MLAPFLDADDERELIPSLDILLGFSTVYLGADNDEDILSNPVITSSG